MYRQIRLAFMDRYSVLRSLFATEVAQIFTTAVRCLLTTASLSIFYTQITNAATTTKNFPVGFNGTLECEANERAVNWVLYTTTTKRISFRNQLLPNEPGKYALDGSNLIVNNLTVHDAGEYHCELPDVTHVFTVTVHEPTCTSVTGIVMSSMSTTRFYEISINWKNVGSTQSSEPNNKMIPVIVSLVIVIIVVGVIGIGLGCIYYRSKRQKRTVPNNLAQDQPLTEDHTTVIGDATTSRQNQLYTDKSCDKSLGVQRT